MSLSRLFIPYAHQHYLISMLIVPGLMSYWYIHLLPQYVTIGPTGMPTRPYMECYVHTIVI